MPRNRFAQFVAKSLSFGPLGDVQRMTRRGALLQRERLVYLLRQAANTDWGHRHRFREILSSGDPVEAFQRRVPLRRYADFESSIERMRRGATDILWPGRCHSFGISGGTYSTGKVVPANSDMLRRTIHGGFVLSANYLATTGNLDALTGAIIPLTGRLFATPTYPGTILGNFSGLLTHFKLQEAAAKRKPLPCWFPDDLKSLYLADWEEKLNRLADVTMQSDVRYIALIPTWGLVFFRKLLERFAKSGRSCSSLSPAACRWTPIESCSPRS
jgi:hypothetical protein